MRRTLSRNRKGPRALPLTALLLLLMVLPYLLHLAALPPAVLPVLAGPRATGLWERLLQGLTEFFICGF
jgi:hypothetical protein